MLNLDNKTFIAVENTANGEVSSQTELRGFAETDCRVFGRDGF